MGRTKIRYPIALALLTAFLLGLLLTDTSLAVSQVQGEWIPCPNQATEEFISNTITSLEADRQGRMWVGTDVGLAWTSDNGQTWNVVDLAHAGPVRAGKPSAPLSQTQRIARNNITSIAAGPSGIWVGTLNGLCLPVSYTHLRAHET